MERELTRRLMSTLGPVVGADHLRATVNVEYETGSSEESQEKYDPAVSATLTMQHSEEVNASGAATGGVPGTSSNVPSPKTNAAKTAAKEISQSSKTDNNTYGVNKTTRHVIEPAGGVRRITAAVLLDDAIDRQRVNGKWVESPRKRQPEELKLIQDLAEAAIGFNSARGDMISVQNLSFDRGPVEDDQPVTLVDRARKGLTDYSSAVRYGAIFFLFLLVYLLAIRPLQKRALAAPEKLVVATAALAPLRTEVELAAPETPATLAQRSQTLKKQLAEFVKAEPESSTTVVRAWLREEATP